MGEFDEFKNAKLCKKTKLNLIPPAGPVDGGRQDPRDGRRSSWGSRRWRGASWGWTLSTISPLTPPSLSSSLLLSSPQSPPSIWSWQHYTLLWSHQFICVQNESLKRYQLNDNVLMIKKKEKMFTFYLLPDNRELKLVPRWEITRSKDHFFTFTILISHGIDIDDIDIHCQWHPPNEC